jgi:hypothetical protein
MVAVSIIAVRQTFHQRRQTMIERISQMAERPRASVSRQLDAVRCWSPRLRAMPAVSHAGRRQPRLCLAGSGGGCAGQLEGNVCIADGTFGVCQGPKPRGDKSTVTICGCG